MGNVRSTLVKRTARKTLLKYPDKFEANFEHNKHAISDLLVFPSKRMRNMVAGYLTCLFKQKNRK